MNVLLIAILLVNAAILCLVAVFLFNIRRVYLDIVDFITPKGDNLPSPAAEMLNHVAENVAEILTIRIKTTFMGKQSGANRGEVGIEADIGEDMLAMANPALAGILNSFPALKKTLRRNPALLDLAISKLGAKFGAAGGPTAANNGHSQTEFDMSIK